MDKNEFDINLEVLGTVLPVKVKRGDEQEEFLYREAAKRIQREWVRYRQRFPKSLVADEKISAMLLIHLAREVLQLENKNDTEPYDYKIQQLTDLLESYLKE
ncbi:MAG: cell division protein ZapA [Tannerella sp.]|nr:cell division protein ZapA [Tannerella sp.]